MAPIAISIKDLFGKTFSVSVKDAETNLVLIMRLT